MIGRRKHTVVANGEAVAARGVKWWSERTRQREQAEADAELIRDLRWNWRSACSATSLSPMIYTPSGATRAVPLITQIDLGPPVSFTVRIRPGQTLADFVAAAPAIAPSLNATALEVTPFGQFWVRIVLRQAPLVGLPGTIFRAAG